MVSFMYFDVGGVVINDFSATNHWEGLKHELGVTTDEQSQQFETFWEKYADSVCTTQDVDDLLPALTDELNLTFPAGYSLLAAFVRRFSTNEDIWPIVEEVQRTHKTGLLTNMYPRMFKKIEDAALLPTGAKWDALIDSGDIGHARPSKEIYD
ncbi:MAG: hypothetical protein OXQ96_04830, partial [Alphaproteobacteria bacterium]|nr:hypothetical protein [Alphaproteobacteria bacterium]